MPDESQQPATKADIRDLQQNLEAVELRLTQRLERAENAILAAFDS